MSAEQPDDPSPGKQPPVKKCRGCLRGLMVLALLIAVVLFVAADHVFNLRSNATYLAFRYSKAPLEAKVAGGAWKPVSSLTVAELDHALVTRAQSPGASWKTLAVRRAASDITQKAVQAVFDAEVCVVEFSPTRYLFSTSFRPN